MEHELIGRSAAQTSAHERRCALYEREARTQRGGRGVKFRVCVRMWLTALETRCREGGAGGSERRGSESLLRYRRWGYAGCVTTDVCNRIQIFLSSPLRVLVPTQPAA